MPPRLAGRLLGGSAPGDCPTVIYGPFVLLHVVSHPPASYLRRGLTAEAQERESSEVQDLLKSRLGTGPSLLLLTTFYRQKQVTRSAQIQGMGNAFHLLRRRAVTDVEAGEHLVGAPSALRPLYYVIGCCANQAR